MNDKIDLYTEGLHSDHNAIELEVFYNKDARRRGIYFRMGEVHIYDGGRTYTIDAYYLNSTFRSLIWELNRGNAKKLAAFQAAVFAGVDREQLIGWFKLGDRVSIVTHINARILPLFESAA